MRGGGKRYARMHFFDTWIIGDRKGCLSVQEGAMRH